MTLQQNRRLSPVKSEQRIKIRSPKLKETFLLSAQMRRKKEDTKVILMSVRNVLYSSLNGTIQTLWTLKLALVIHLQ